MSVRFSRRARWTLASVCASMPCVASTTRIAPSQACEAVTDLVREVDVTGRVDQVEAIDQAVARDVLESDGAGLDRDALLALEIHRIEDLAGHLPALDRVRQLEQAVGQRRLAVVDVGDDREVAQALLGDGHGAAV